MNAGGLPTRRPSQGAGLPATHTRLMQYRLPLLSGRLWPRCVPAVLTVSPSGSTRTCSQLTSLSLQKR